MKKHLAIMPKTVIESILNGQKSIETRFSSKKIAPIFTVSPGDIVYMKVAGGDVIGQFRVKKVIDIQGLEKEDFQELFNVFGQKIKSGDSDFDTHFYNEKLETAKFGCLIFIAEAERLITSPIRLLKTDRRSWVILD